MNYVVMQGIIVYRGAYFGLYDTATVMVFGDKAKTANVFAKWAVAQARPPALPACLLPVAATP